MRRFSSWWRGLESDLEPEDQLLYAVLMGFTDPGAATARIDGLLDAAKQASGLKREVQVSAEVEQSRATLRFRSLCSSLQDCAERFGPFAPYLLREVRQYTAVDFDGDFPTDPVQFEKSGAAGLNDDILIVVGRSASLSWAEIVVHELQHRLRPLWARRCLLRMGAGSQSNETYR